MERVFSPTDPLSSLHALEPAHQADVLSQVAQQARLLRLALSAERSDADTVASSFERALGDVMDADADSESERARLGLVSVLTELRSAGLTVSATLDDMVFDGVLGAQRLPVLTAVLRAG